MNQLEVRVGNLKLKSPLMSAAGTAGHSDELSRLRGFDYNDLGAFVTKGVTLEEKQGNPQKRIAEVSGGLINSIGLQNRGLKYFMEKELPKLKKFNLPIIVNICASSLGEFEIFCERMVSFESCDLISAVEVNVSCPNVTAGGMALGTDSLTVELILSQVRYYFQNKIIITKLTPNVTNIVEIAEAAIGGGTDALSMINTVRGCAVDLENKKFVLGRKFGGLSGPAIKSIGLFAVHKCFTEIARCKNRNIPIIGIGGIMNYRDVLEYIMVGASAVQIGSGFFFNPNIYKEIRMYLEEYLKKEDQKISDLIGVIC